jgi:hypothetical protein
VSKRKNYKHFSYSYPYCDLVTNYIYTIVRVFEAEGLTCRPKILYDKCIVISLFAYFKRIFGSTTVSYEIMTNSIMIQFSFLYNLCLHIPLPNYNLARMQKNVMYV